ncbi:MFS transporter [Salimicrobium flavidum]|uniref:MFS transporter, YNFM family, putative membrane transport protein n=1 Tax=Salimicrobium flavidum TaxID=570947 RepID=A0A1N7JJ41_9BACI|nr:MFS transporter [Salimicrobium flavidum]SIS49345.1 MFS transporter, YNFM family, putative membrane transport protein [Salimicrobium flavidum]
MAHHHPYTPKDKNFWRVTLSLALASFFIFATMYAVQPLFPVYVEEFGIGISAASLSLSLTIAGLIAGLVVIGFFSDRHGRTVFMKAAVAGATIPFLLIPWTDSFFVLLCLRFVQGVALSGLPAAALAYLHEEIDSKSVHVATALYISSNALGGMAGRVLAGAITDFFSWHTYFYLLGGIGTLMFLLMIWLLPASRFFEPSELSFRHDLQAFSYHLKNPVLLLIFGLGIVFQTSFTGVWTYLPFYLQGDPFSLSLASISLFYFAYGVGVIGSPLAGWLAGHFSLSSVRISGIFVLSAGIFTMLSHSIWVLALGLGLLCLGFFTAHSLTASSIGELVSHHKGSASSLYLVSYYIGVVTGSSMLGPLYDAWGWTGLIVVLSLLPLAYIGLVKQSKSTPSD